MNKEDGKSPYEPPQSPQSAGEKTPKPTFTEGTWSATKWVVLLVAVVSGLVDGFTNIRGFIPPEVLGYTIAAWVVPIFPGIIVYYCVPRQPIAYNVVMLVFSGLVGLGNIVIKLLMTSAGYS